MKDIKDFLINENDQATWDKVNNMLEEMIDAGGSDPNDIINDLLNAMGSQLALKYVKIIYDKNK